MVFLHVVRPPGGLDPERADPDRKHNAAGNPANLVRVKLTYRDGGQDWRVVGVSLLKTVRRIQAVERGHEVVVQMVVGHPPGWFLGDPGAEERRWEVGVAAATGHAVKRDIVLTLDVRIRDRHIGFLPIFLPPPLMFFPNTPAARRPSATIYPDRVRSAGRRGSCLPQVANSDEIVNDGLEAIVGLEIAGESADYGHRFTWTQSERAIGPSLSKHGGCGLGRNLDRGVFEGSRQVP